MQLPRPFILNGHYYFRESDFDLWAAEYDIYRAESGMDREYSEFDPDHQHQWIAQQLEIDPNKLIVLFAK